MKKWIALTLVLATALCLLSGCASSKPNSLTISSGTLTVATSPDYAPFEFYALDAEGNPTLTGFDMSLAQYIADYMGLKLEVIPMDFDGTIMELANKKVDLSMAGYSPDPDRLDKMDFSDIYYVSEQSFVTVKDKAGLFATLEDANNSAYQIGVQIGSIQADLAHEHTPNADIVELSKVTDIIAELLAGKLDGAFIETPVVEAYAASHPDLIALHKVEYDASGSVVGVYKGNDALLKAVNEAIAAAIADGSFDKFVTEAVELAAGSTYEGLLEDKE